MFGRKGTRCAGGAIMLCTVALLGAPHPDAPLVTVEPGIAVTGRGPEAAVVAAVPGTEDEASLAQGGRRHVVFCVAAAAATAILGNAAIGIPGGPALVIVAMMPLLVSACS